jgi:hypothetical protein
MPTGAVRIRRDFRQLLSVFPVSTSWTVSSD